MTALYCIIGALLAVLLFLTGLEVYCRIRARWLTLTEYDIAKLLHKYKDEQIAKEERESWR